MSGITVGLYTCGQTDLRLCDPTATSPVQTATTAFGGGYTFANPAPLDVGQSYYVAFVNSATTSYLFYWKTALITSYVAGQNLALPSFDIATFALNSPADGSRVFVPVQFQWTQRGNNLPTERYAWGLEDQTGHEVCVSNPASGATYILTSAQSSACGLKVATPYTWYIYAVNGTSFSNGYGVSWATRSITFASTLLSLPVPLPLLD